MNKFLKHFLDRLAGWWKEQMYPVNGRSTRPIRVTVEPSTERRVRLRRK